MHINQILAGQEPKVTAKLATEGVMKEAKPEKVGGFTVPITTKGEVDTGVAGIAEKARSMTENHTKNNAEYIAGVMNEDLCEKAEEKGIDLSKEDEKTIVTVVDKIQMELIEGGNEEVMATANLSKAELTSMTPGAQAAYDMAAELVTPTKEAVSYLVSNELEPTVGNFYQAQNVTAAAPKPFHGTEGKHPETEKTDDPRMVALVEKHLPIIGIEPTSENIEIGKKMVSEGVLLSRANFNYFKAATNAELPMPETRVTKEVMDAVAMRRDPAAAMVLPQYSWQHRAEDAVNVLQEVTDEDIVEVVESGKELTIANLEEAKAVRELAENDTKTFKGASLTITQRKEITVTLQITRARRTIEEARASMTFEANLSLLKRGIHLETDSIEMMLNELKAREESLEKLLLGPMKKAQDVTDVLDQVKQAPAYMMQSFTMNYTLTEVQEITVSVTEESKAVYARANGAYETMMTEVRPDLGDTIQKAFRNVDDILEDMKLPVNESNERAVRILGYNHQEITVENITAVKAKDEQMQSLFTNMTPKVVLSMIREGYNPLDVPLTELAAKAKEMQEKIDPFRADHFSRFLVEMESRGEIDQEERDGFVGIYRLLRQVEKSDGAAVGASLLSGGEVTMRNLMTQVRSQRTGHVDIVADDKVGEKNGSYVADLSITQQIEAAYQTSCVGNALSEISGEKLQHIAKKADIMDMTPEQLLNSLRQETEDVQEQEEARSREIREAYRMLNSQEELSQFFENFEVPKSPENILAIADYLQDRNRLYRTLYKKQKESENIFDTLKDIKEDIWEKFSEQVKTPEDMAKAQEALADLAEHVMDNMMATEDTQTLDIRQLQLMHRQVALLSQMGKKEEYAVPVLVADEMGCVNLKIVRGKEEKGKVAITTMSETLGKIAAEIAVTSRGISAYIVSDNQSTTEKLREKTDELTAGLQQEVEDTSVSLTYVTSSQLSLTQFYQGSGVSEGEATEIQTKTLYSMARVFLRSLSET